jgi:hypothetical protein
MCGWSVKILIELHYLDLRSLYFLPVLQMSCQRISKRVHSEQTRRDKNQNKSLPVWDLKQFFSSSALLTTNSVRKYTCMRCWCALSCIWLSETALMCVYIIWLSGSSAADHPRRSVGFFRPRRGARLSNHPSAVWLKCGRHLDICAVFIFGPLSCFRVFFCHTQIYVLTGRWLNFGWNASIEMLIKI